MDLLLQSSDEEGKHNRKAEGDTCFEVVQTAASSKGSEVLVWGIQES